MSQLRPFRQYDEHDVINLFTCHESASTAGVILSDGKLVKVHTGWETDNDPVDLAGNASGHTIANVLSTTWSLTAKVVSSGTGDIPLGMTLVGVRDLDENGEKLIYNPRKAIEMGVVVPGQSIPILTRGLVIVKSADATWVPVAGDPVYGGASGEFTTTSSGNVAVGTALGAKDANGFALIKLDL